MPPAGVTSVPLEEWSERASSSAVAKRAPGETERHRRITGIMCSDTSGSGAGAPPFCCVCSTSDERAS